MVWVGSLCCDRLCAGLGLFGGSAFYVSGWGDLAQCTLAQRGALYIGGPRDAPGFHWLCGGGGIRNGGCFWAGHAPTAGDDYFLRLLAGTRRINWRDHYDHQLPDDVTLEGLEAGGVGLGMIS